RSARSELSKNPAIGELVIEDDRIARIIGLAVPPKAAPESIICCRPEERIPGLVENLEMQIGHRDHVIRTNCSIGIGRRATTKVAVSIETDDRSRYPNLAEHSLHDRVPNDRTDRSERNRALFLVLTLGTCLCNERLDAAQWRRD